jgi:hypothetical protein
MFVKLTKGCFASLAHCCIHRGKALTKLSEKLCDVGVQEVFNIAEGFLKCAECVQLNLCILISEQFANTVCYLTHF